MKVISPLRMSELLVRDTISAASETTTCSSEAKKEFENSRLPFPTPGTINIDPFHAKNLNLIAGERWVWFVTQGDPQSVFFDESSGLFGCCWGPDQATGGYADLGFRSQDPVEMYLV